MVRVVCAPLILFLSSCITPSATNSYAEITLK